MTLTLKRHHSHHAEFEFTFEARELSEQFTDEQLRSVGLFRSLRDADLARLRDIEKRESDARCSCEDDECDCECHAYRARHQGKSHSVQTVQPNERDFWPLIRALLLRRDLTAVIAEIERRAWEAGNTTINLATAIKQGS